MLISESCSLPSFIFSIFFTTAEIISKPYFPTLALLNGGTFSGKEIVVTDSPFGRLGLTVCYDLRFPEIYQLLRFHHNAQVQVHS